VTIKQLTDYRHAQRWDPRMQVYADNHVLADTQAIADVAAHVASLLRLFRGAVDGGRPNFDARHVQLLQQIDREELTALADTLARME
jgi:hypothetical protein